MYIATADDRKVEALYTIMEKELQVHETCVSDEEWLMISEVMQRHLAGEGTSSPCEEVLERLGKGRARKHAA